MNETQVTTTGTGGVEDSFGPKSEIRDPKAERSPNSEVRITHLVEPTDTRQPAALFGSRTSAFFRASVFGLRISALRQAVFSRRAFHRASLALLTAAVTTTAAWSAYRWWEYTQTWTNTDNAYVAAHIHQVSPRVAGTISEVLVEENQVVAAGQVLARLDARDFEVRRQQVLAQLAQARAQAQQAQARIAQARSEVTREQVQCTKTQQDLERAKALSQHGNEAISRQEYDAAQAAADAAQAALAAAKSALQSAEAAAGAAEAQEKVAETNLKDAELQLSYTDILAPAAGRIGKKSLETGNRVQPGQALLALVQPEVWVVANFKETQLASVRPGQPARLRLDAFPGRMFTGRVESLSPASGAQFALLPPDNATGNFTRIVQRVPVRIALEGQTLGDCEGRLVPGMSAVVQIRVRMPQNTRSAPGLAEPKAENIQHPTSNIQHPLLPARAVIGGWVFDVGCWMFSGFTGRE
jgi:membrane fusion protein, multidrug efflux system